MASNFPDQYSSSNEGNRRSKLQVTAVTARVVTMVSLVVSLAVIQTNDVTLDNKYVLTYKYFNTYKYMFYVTVIGLVYTALQIPFAVYYLVRNKYLLNSPAFFKFDFYADKVVGVVLAIGAGAATAATVELRRKKDWYDNDKFQDFLGLMYIPAACLLLASVSSLVSSIHSSLALISTT